MSKVLVASAAAALFALVANAQSAPDWKLVPAKCASDCAQTVEASYLCEQQYTIGTHIYGCFCESYPSDAAACATCLEANDSAALANLLKGTQTDCQTQTKSCAFACAFETCDSANVACQCDAGYLANIYNCASCNTANGNQGTLIGDFQALNASCGNQNYTGVTQAFNTWAPSPTGKDSYAAPTLTATGGGEAATGTFAAATDKAAATDAGAAAGATTKTDAAAPTTTGTGAAPTGATTGTAGAHSSSAGASQTHATGTGSSAAPSASHSSPAKAVAVPAAAAVAGALVAVLL